MSLRIRRWSAAIDPRIPLLDHGPNRSISAGSTAGKGNVRKGFANSRGKARGKSFGPVSLHVCAGLEQTLKRAEVFALLWELSNGWIGLLGFHLLRGWVGSASGFCLWWRLTSGMRSGASL